ncbi:MAG TPA: YfhO family protein, partial [Vicinamibacteria bacterium]|nr:YfhO family protein [Vicinamibacteria bacterium]
DAAAGVVPPLRLLRYPSKAAVPAALALCLLSGLGVQAAAASRRGACLLSLALAGATLVAGAAWAIAVGGASCLTARPHPGSPTWSELLASSAEPLAVAFAASGLALAVSLLGQVGSRPWTPAAVALLGVGALVADGRRINPTVDGWFFQYRPEVVDVVGGGRRLYVWDYVLRVAGRSHLIEDAQALLRARPNPRWPQKVSDAVAFTTYLYPPIAGRFGLRGSYERDLLGLYPKGLSEMTKALRAVEDTPGFLRLLQVGAVDFVVALHAEGQEELLGPGRRLPSPFTRPIFVFAVPGARPRCYAVGSAVRLDGDAAFARLLAPEFDPSREIVLSDGGAELPTGEFTGVARLVDERPGRVAIDADLSAPGYVVYVATHDPGWRARVDGREAQTLRANGLFLAVAAGAGHHRVELVYVPRTLGAGLGLALGSLALAAFSFARPRGRAAGGRAAP